MHDVLSGLPDCHVSLCMTSSVVCWTAVSHTVWRSQWSAGLPRLTLFDVLSGSAELPRLTLFHVLSGSAGLPRLTLFHVLSGSTELPSLTLFDVLSGQLDSHL
jgi:hypothetical protein